ncbi:MAG: serine hydrolase domain-containing protein [Planctomycetota bacterium]
MTQDQASNSGIALATTEDHGPPIHFNLNAIRSAVWLHVIAIGVATAGQAHAHDQADPIQALEAAVSPGFIIAGEETALPTLEARMESLGVPAVSVAVIDDGVIAWSRAWGQADRATGRKATPETVFQAASISKPIAAMAALTLVDDERLALDTDVTSDLKKWSIPASTYTETESVTLRRLLNHTAGLNVHGFPGFAPDAEIPSAAGILRGDGNTDAVVVEALPGEAFRYSGGGYTIMEVLVEDVTQQDFATFADGAVLEPLNMNRSAFAQPISPALRDNAAVGYWDVDRPVDGGAHTYPQRAAAGLWTTPTDLAQCMISIYDAQHSHTHPVLSMDVLRTALEPGLNEWGLGFEVKDNGTRIAHGGANEGFRCWMTMSLATGDGVVVMTNSDGGGQLCHELALTVAREYGWTGFEPEVKHVVDLTDSQFKNVEGVYTVEGWGSATVEYRNGELWAEPTWDDHARLMPESPTQFFVRDTAMPVRFVEEDGKIVAAIFGSWRFERTMDE